MQLHERMNRSVRFEPTGRLHNWQRKNISRLSMKSWQNDY